MDKKTKQTLLSKCHLKTTSFVYIHVIPDGKQLTRPCSVFGVCWRFPTASRQVNLSP